MLESAPELQATTILAYLTAKYHGNYNGKQLRCLQKRLKQWRAAHGKDKTVIFLQNILPGKQSQSDWTNMNQLGICIGGQPYPHLLFHFMLPYSCWETFSICHSESFDTLASGFEKAVWELGGVLPEHRTDNLSAATKQCGNSDNLQKDGKNCLVITMLHHREIIQASVMKMVLLKKVMIHLSKQ
ncbi:hypothetical protein [Rickettsia endosymbiont of Urophora cardui]|uniref:hypothetical protein n=1 Tax=Rickettsia endosymbiont of Urophora cardui TaxID=3066265 RepID=UPI00313E9AE9